MRLRLVTLNVQPIFAWDDGETLTLLTPPVEPQPVPLSDLGSLPERITAMARDIEEKAGGS
jgi:hypothetical protein